MKTLKHLELYNNQDVMSEFVGHVRSHNSGKFIVLILILGKI